nr:YHS domain-containing (seleno)protein [Rhodoplanes serenus]
MTSRRRTRQIVPTLRGAAGLAMLMLSSLWLGPPASAATTERVVTDRHSGLAISGFDPVAYFVDRAAVEGRAEYEYTYAGTVWRFRNPGNRNAFADNPTVYAPVFGGYDPVGIARGVSRPGNPGLFAVMGGRVFLFYSETARDKFMTDPVGVLTEAQNHWPQVRAGLTP